MPLFVIPIILFVFGLGFGSFLNVLTIRYNPEESFFKFARARGRSACMSCGKTLQWFELIPIVSFVLQRGKCRSCGVRVSFQYPLVEFMGGAIMWGVPTFFATFYSIRIASSVSFETLFALPLWYYAISALWILAFFTLLAIIVIDIRHYIIPNELNLLLFVVSLILLFILFLGHRSIPVFRDSFLEQYALLFSPNISWIALRFIGLGVGVIFFGALSILSRGRAMGFGDVKLAGATGLLLGWPDMAVAMLLSFIIGGIVGLCAMVFKKKGFKDKLPFAPFFVLGFTLTVFCGAALLNAYFHLFQLI